MEVGDVCDVSDIASVTARQGLPHVTLLLIQLQPYQLVSGGRWGVFNTRFYTSWLLVVGGAC